MADITNPKWLYAKAGLLLATGFFAAVLLVLEMPSWKVVGLLLVAIWAFCRAYYFAFYVIQHYADPRFRFAGLLDFLRFAFGGRGGSMKPPADTGPIV